MTIPTILELVELFIEFHNVTRKHNLLMHCSKMAQVRVDKQFVPQQSSELSRIVICVHHS